MLPVKIWKNLPGKYFCISTKDRYEKWDDHFFKTSEFDEVASFVEENMDKDVYWCIHGFDKPRRLKEHAAIPKMLWADLDEIDPRGLDKLTPTIAWESSPGRFACLWMIDQYMTEDLNQRLTLHIGADKGGWDLTQVLRVPGTKNYKYTAAPKVKTLWTDGEKFKFDTINKMLPKKAKVDKEKSESAQAIYKRYEKKFDAFIRRELINGKPTVGKRSEVIWKLAHGLIEAGCTRDEAFELLRISPWNKFAQRRDGDKQLRRELEKALKQHLDVSINKKSTFKEEELEEEDEEEHVFLGRSMAEVEEEEIDWIWYPYLARNEVTILEGDPGLGKSYLAQMISGHIVDGKKMPSVRHIKEPVKGKVAYFDIENSSGTVTKKRLVGNDFKNLKDYYQDEEPFSIDDEDTLQRVHHAIEKKKPSLVVFDTLNTYIGKADIHKSSETQQAFKAFVEIARRHNCSVLVLRHLTKSTKERALYRGQGSIAFTGLARVVMTVGVMPDEPDVRVMAVTKINVTRAPRALTFTIKSVEGLKDSDKSRFEWGEFTDLTSDDMLAGPTTQGGGNFGDKSKACEEFIAEILNAGPMDCGKIYRAGEARGFTEKMLKRVSDNMDVKKKQGGFGKLKTSLWTMPQQPKTGKRFQDEDEQEEVSVKKKRKG